MSPYRKKGRSKYTTQMLLPQWVTDRKEEEKKMSNHMAEVEEERKWNKGNECCVQRVISQRGEQCWDPGQLVKESVVNWGYEGEKSPRLDCLNLVNFDPRKGSFSMPEVGRTSIGPIRTLLFPCLLKLQVFFYTFLHGTIMFTYLGFLRKCQESIFEN